MKHFLLFALLLILFFNANSSKAQERFIINGHVKDAENEEELIGVSNETYSISNAGFIYSNDLFNLLKGDVVMFDSPPFNPRTNIKGGVLGFFQTSSKVSQSILIEE